MANADFEARQLLKAYRKGLISDALFEEQMREIGDGNGRRNYTYNGRGLASEREMICALLDEFRCAEDFAAEYLCKWIEVSDQECVKGGLRAVQQREAYHARILEARLRELGGIPQCTVPQERRDKEMPFYASKRGQRRAKIIVDCVQNRRRSCSTQAADGRGCADPGGSAEQGTAPIPD